jgi:hypothetical protein
VIAETWREGSSRGLDCYARAATRAVSRDL